MIAACSANHLWHWGIFTYLTSLQGRTSCKLMRLRSRRDATGQYHASGHDPISEGNLFAGNLSLACPIFNGTFTQLRVRAFECGAVQHEDQRWLPRMPSRNVIRWCWLAYKAFTKCPTSLTCGMLCELLWPGAHHRLCCHFLVGPGSTAGPARVISKIKTF